MSWLFSQALVAAYSAAHCSDGEPSSPSSANPTPQAYLHSDRMTAFSRLSRFGMTFAPLTEHRGAELLTWYLAGFRARTLAQPERALESTEPAAECGHTWPESLARYDRGTHSWKTPQCSLLEGLDEFSETWPRWGMMRDGVCWAQVTPERHTEESEFGFSHLWPSPTSSSNDKTPCRSDALLAWEGKPRPKTGAKVQARLQDAAAYWPTPTVCGNYNRKGSSATSGDGLPTAVKMWPTPTAHSAKETNAKSEAERNTPTLAAQVGGTLNPTWVEWLMGWPPGWTDLKPLGTDKFQRWLELHGRH